MKKNKAGTKKKNTAAAVTVLAVIVSLVLIAGGFGVFGNKTKGKELLKYSYSRGGDMNGSSYSQTVKPLDGEYAVISYSSRDWYYQDPKVSEYKVSIKILEDLNQVFQNNGMYRWHNKKFTDVFVADGATYSYHFYFDGDDIHFSSQIYPQKYRNKLSRIDDVISKYQDNAELLPGLAASDVSNDEMYDRKIPEDGLVRLEVYAYCNDYLCYRILNGTDENVIYTSDYALYREGEEEPVAKYGSNYIHERVAYPHRYEEEGFTLNFRLYTGKYILKVGEYECGFEIK